MAVGLQSKAASSLDENSEKCLPLHPPPLEITPAKHASLTISAVACMWCNICNQLVGKVVLLSGTFVAWLLLFRRDTVLYVGPKYLCKKLRQLRKVPVCVAAIFTCFEPIISYKFPFGFNL